MAQDQKPRARLQGGRSEALLAAGVAAALCGAFLLWRRENAAACARPSPLRSLWSKVNGMRVHARISTAATPPDRLPVILVHGLGMSSRYMMPLAECLGSDLRVLAPDLPGFGLSDKPGRFFTVGEQAGLLAAWMDCVGVRRAAFVGNSLGCEILVEFALRYPQRISRLVLQGPTPDPQALNPARQVALFLLTGLFERPSLVWVALSDYLRSGVRRYVWTFRDMLANRIEHKLPHVRAPTLVVRGTRDFLVPHTAADRVARLLPAGRLVILEGAAHGINYSHPRALADCAVEFLVGPASARR